MKIYYLILPFFLFISSLAVANVPPPPLLGTKGIELTKDYPDYVFYFGKYYVFDEKGRSISKIDLEQIKLTNLIPFTIWEPKNFDLQYFKEKHLKPDQVKFSAREDYLIAVKRDVNDQVKPKLAQKMIELINLKKNGDGIYYAAVPETGLISKPDDVWYGSYEQRILVSKLDAEGLEFQVVRFQEGDNHYTTNPDVEKRRAEENSRKTTGLVGILLLISALIAAIGIYIFRKKRKMK